ncbi:histidine kinase [Microbacterium sp. STN6]|uniref:sensor histidine kinase n=1 Tax=Microbacterium sp. STN6 TaxID=2995588 RepID=UPI002260BB56|nr:histidine kinase [Microbacterium sp. STN6]MCX7522972.1 histidine kinase [Microbacterium sp. STN6]
MTAPASRTLGKRMRRIPQRMRNEGARKWYLGSVWGLVYLAIPIGIVWANSTSVGVAVLTTALLAAIGVVYFFLPPLLWGQGWRFALVALAAFMAFTCLAFPLMGDDAVWLWVYVPIMASMSWQPRGLTVGSLVFVVGLQMLVVWVQGDLAENWYSAAVTASIGVMMYAFSQQIQAIYKLKAAQSEIARLAVVDERARFSRDMHDVLGHSLTVVTVKSELARRLVSLDPARAEGELEDIERMTRAALADLRSAVAGYREMSLPTELAAAQAALTAADIVPHLPTHTDAVSAELRELFAWVLRESVTNVIRHSGAKNCWIALEPRAIVIGDDGRGGERFAGGVACEEAAGEAGDDERAGRGAPGDGVVGSGLRGLAVRAKKAGAILTVTPSEDGGVLVTARGA